MFLVLIKVIKKLKVTFFNEKINVYVKKYLLMKSLMVDVSSTKWEVLRLVVYKLFACRLQSERAKEVEKSRCVEMCQC